VVAEVAESDHVAFLEGRDQDLLGPGQEPVAVDRAVDNERRSDLIAPQRGNEGERGPATVRDLGDEPPAARAATMGAGHVGLGPGLVDEDQARRIKPLLPPFPALALPGHVRPILLGCVQYLQLHALDPTRKLCRSRLGVSHDHVVRDIQFG
jgi:hypothetical protein